MSKKKPKKKKPMQNCVNVKANTSKHSISTTTFYNKMKFTSSNKQKISQSIKPLQ